MWNLVDETGVLSQHPNREGARMSAMFHVKVGDKVTWKYADNDVPTKVAAEYGYVNGDMRFKIQEE